MAVAGGYGSTALNIAGDDELLLDPKSILINPEIPSQLPSLWSAARAPRRDLSL